MHNAMYIFIDSFLPGSHWSKIEWKEAGSVLQGKICILYRLWFYFILISRGCNPNQEAVSDAN